MNRTILALAFLIGVVLLQIFLSRTEHKWPGLVLLISKGVVFYFNDWIDEKIISILEEIVEQFLSLTQAQFTKKRSGENDAYVNRRNIRGGWKKVQGTA